MAMARRGITHYTVVHIIDRIARNEERAQAFYTVATQHYLRRLRQLWEGHRFGFMAARAQGKSDVLLQRSGLGVRGQENSRTLGPLAAEGFL